MTPRLSRWELGAQGTEDAEMSPKTKEPSFSAMPEFVPPRTMTPEELGDTLARLVWESFSDFVSEGDADAIVRDRYGHIGRATCHCHPPADFGLRRSAGEHRKPRAK